MKITKINKYITLAIVAGIGYGTFHLANYYHKKSVLKTYLSKYSSQKPQDIIDFDKYDFFITGEMHSVSKNFDIQKQMIKSLSEKTDLKYIITEESMANALIINDYLKTGNLEKLDKIFQNLKRTFAYSRENYDFYQFLYEFNKNLPEEKKITYIGVDIEHQYGTTLEYLRNFIDDKNAPVIVSNFIKDFFEKYNKENRMEYCKKILDDKILENILLDIENSKKTYEAAFGDDLWTFRYLINNLKNTCSSYIVCDRDDEFMKIRETAILSNFAEIYNHFPNGKFFGQWGNWHIFAGKSLWFSMNYDENSPIKNKVCRIPILYFDSSHMDRKNFESCKIEDRDFKYSNGKYEFDVVKSLTQEKPTFFKIDVEKNAFYDEVISDNKATIYSDGFPYIVGVKDSKACTPFRKK